MQVSVIIPVYNAADYIQQAVESALAQPETGEVILVEDGSQDNSLVICKKLADAHPKVHLHRHPGGKNRGEAASRNLAIRKSTCEYIAGLDADDFFLPGRFSVAKELLEANPQLDGVYEALGEYIESEAALQRWNEVRRPRGLTTMTIRVAPEQLFNVLVTGKHGFFHLNATVLKRTVFDRTGPFDEHLRLATDTAMLWKIAAVARLVPGRLDEPVAMRRIHEHNVSSKPQLRSPRQKYGVWMKVFSCAWRWCRRNKIDKEKREIVLHRFLNYAVYSKLNRTYPKWTYRFQKRFWLMLLLFRHPLLILEPSFWERLIPNRVGILCRRLAKA